MEEKKLIPPSHFACADENASDLSADFDLQAKLTALNVLSKDYLERQQLPACTTKQVLSSQVESDANSQQKRQCKSTNRAEIERLKTENEILQKILSDQKPDCALKENMAPIFIKDGQTRLELLQQNASDLTTALIKKDNIISTTNCQLDKLSVENVKLSKLCDDRKTENQKLIIAVSDKERELNKTISEANAEKARMLSDFETTKLQMSENCSMKCKTFEDEIIKAKCAIEELEQINVRCLNELKQQQTNELEDLRRFYQHKIKELDEKSVSEIARVCNENKELRSEADRMNEETEITKSQLEDEIEKNKSLKLELEERSSCVESLNCELANEKKNILNLRSYVSDVQKDDLERANWKNEKQSLYNEVKDVESKASALTKTLELQAIRFESITKILETQEDKIHTQGKALPSGDLAHPEQMIIRKWREKVFELMVQVKSQELVARETRSKFQLSENCLKSKLQDQERDCVILQSQLTEVKAQLQLHQNQIHATNAQNKKLHTELNSCRQKLQEYEKVFGEVEKTIKTQTENVENLFTDSMVKILSKNSRHEQRILFATNRLRTIHDLMSRKWNVERAKCMEKFKDVSTSTDDMQSCDSESLLLEIDKMVSERDQLSRKLKDDAAVFENAVSDFQKQIKGMETTIVELQQQFDDKAEDCNNLSNEVENLKMSLRGCESKRVEADEKYSELKKKFDGEVETILNEKKTTWNAEKLDLQAQLNDAKTELAKALVTQRQAQRSFARELKAATEDLQTTIDRNQHEMKRSRTKVKQYEQDNNLLMTTLRQEGLISAYKANRTQYKNSLRELKQNNESAKKQSDENATSCQFADSAKQNDCKGDAAEDENMKEILKELVAMTDDVLNDVTEDI